MFMWHMFQQCEQFPASVNCREHSSSGSPPPSPFLFFSLILQCHGCLFSFPFCEGSWLGCSVVPAMGALFSLRAGCRKWKPLDIPGTQPPYNAVVNCMYHIIYSWSYSDGRVPSDLSKQIEEDSTCMVQVLILLMWCLTLLKITCGYYQR